MTEYDTKKLKELLENGLLPNDVVNQIGMTPLQLSAYRGLEDEVLVLLQFGANPHVYGTPGTEGGCWTARRFAELGGHEEIAKLLEKAEKGIGNVL